MKISTPCSGAVGEEAVCKPVRATFRERRSPSLLAGCCGRTTVRTSIRGVGTEVESTLIVLNGTDRAHWKKALALNGDHGKSEYLGWEEEIRCRSFLGCYVVAHSRG